MIEQIVKLFNCINSVLTPYKKSFISALKKVYSIIEILSTLTIFSALLLFTVGKAGFGDSCDDDLIMKGIQNQLPKNLSISNIYIQDIHGLGNDSMLVFASDDTANKIENQLLIYDKIDNDFLNNLYNLFGYGSNYKLSYSFSLQNVDKDDSLFWGYSLKILDMVDLTGDLSKEIIVQFMPHPVGTSGYYQIGIFSYSYKNQSYYLLGTYPPSGIYNVDKSRSDNLIPTVFHSNNANNTNLYDGQKFQLEYSTMDDNDFFVKDDYATYLIRTKMIWGDESHIEPHRHIISVFTPQYNVETNELEWNVDFSKETDDYVQYCSKEFVQDFLDKNNRGWIMGE